MTLTIGTLISRNIRLNMIDCDDCFKSLHIFHEACKQEHATRNMKVDFANKGNCLYLDRVLTVFLLENIIK